MKRKVLGVLFTAMCLCAVPSAAYAEAQEAETTEAAGEAADEPEAGAETVTELSDSLYDFQVKIGDKVYQFPMYYQDFAADWTLGKNEDPEVGVSVKKRDGGGRGHPLRPLVEPGGAGPGHGPGPPDGPAGPCAGLQTRRQGDH